MSNTDRHPKCHMRTALGNCDPIGGFCTSVNESICEALHKVSRPQGEWVNVKISISGDSSAECSLCGAIVHNNFSNVINFCPNCGAKMDKERKGKCKECWYWSEVYKRCENKCGCQFKPYEERKESER